MGHDILIHAGIWDEVDKNTAEARDASLNDLLSEPVNTFFPSGTLDNIVADQKTIDEAKEKGEPVGGKTIDGAIEAYYWKGHIYVASITVEPEADR